jgi:hypothetical protein
MDATTLLANQQAVGLLEDHLARGVGMIPQLVLEALQQQRIDRAVRQKARHKKTGQPTGGLCKHQEGIAHRRRQKPLVPGEAVFQSGAPGRHGHGAWCVGADIGATLFLGHAHAHQRAALVGRRRETGIVLTR